MLIFELFSNPLNFVMIAIALLFGLTIHEYFHGWVAYMLGDDTAKLSGRLTVNPLAHFDPVLTTMALIFGIGAAKPVPINPYRLKYGNRGMLFVSLAGIAANFVSAVVFVIILKVLLTSGNFSNNNLIFNFLSHLIQINLVLMVFNLIPIPPLDGSKILLVLIPDSYGNAYHYFSQNQGMSLFLAIILFFYFGYDVINFFYGLIIRLVF